MHGNNRGSVQMWINASPSKRVRQREEGDARHLQREMKTKAVGELWSAIPIETCGSAFFLI